MGHDDVRTAFEILLEALESEIDDVSEVGCSAMKKSEYDVARQTLGIAEQLADCRSRVRQLATDWEGIRAMYPATASQPDRPDRRRPPSSRLPAGLRTPVSEFRGPILQVLREMGGHGEVDAVLTRVEALMSNRLNEYDRQPLASGAVRWRNTAQWCRNDLVEEGLINRGSRRGTWELTDRGRTEADRLAPAQN